MWHIAVVVAINCA